MSTGKYSYSKKWYRLALVVLVLFGVGVAAAWFRHSPQTLPAGSESESRLQSGHYSVLVDKLVLSDGSRATTPEQGDHGVPYRELPTQIWYPANSGQGKVAAGEFPLVVFSHGFMGSSEDAAYLGQFLASHGYIVVAMSFPLTSLGAAGEAEVMDVANQPGDVSFVIDTLLEWNHTEGGKFYQRIDPSRIVLMGHSLGGMTTTLASYHPRLRDHRVSAAISLAGPLEMFGSTFFSGIDIPFLLIAGDIDAMVDYETNARYLPERIGNASLVTFASASHTGFTDQASYLRFFDNADTLGCMFVAKRVNEETPVDDMPLYRLLGTEAEGILLVPPGKICQQDPLPVALSPSYQQALTKIAVHAFLESVMSRDEASRSDHQKFLRQTFPQEISGISVEWTKAG